MNDDLRTYIEANIATARQGRRVNPQPLPIVRTAEAIERDEICAEMGYGTGRYNGD